MILLDTQDLLIFEHVAGLHSISRAAEKLDYVQSNVSQRMKILEDELGARLLIRSNRGVKLTACLSTDFSTKNAFSPYIV